MIKKIRENSLYLALMIAILAMMGSLYFSEIAGLAPCLLCWYQRIAMYPLVPVLAVGIATRDKNAWRYGLPLSIIGSLIGIYHVLLTWGVITIKPGACGLGVSCATITWSVFGFITIPLLSLLAFLSITGLLLLNRKHSKFSIL